MPFRKNVEGPMKKRMIILFVVIVLAGCGTGRDGNPKAVPESFKVGESVYVCGCPMMCCNSVSKEPGRCACNVPLRKGNVSRIREGAVFVKIDDGREKRFFITNR